MANYSHIRTGLYLMNSITLTDQTFIANHYDAWVFSQNSTHDLTTAITANPDLLIFSYTSGNTVYRWSSSAYTALQSNWASFLQWCIDNGKDYEDAFWHYHDDMIWASGKPQPTDDWSATTMVTGFTAGTVPGYDGGGALTRINSRMPGSPSFFDPGVVTRTISTIIGTSGTVTVTTSVAHLLYTGDSIAISGTTNFNDAGPVLITVTGASTFTYSKAGDTAQENAGTVTYNALRGWYLNYHETVMSDYMVSRLDTACSDSVGNHLNGYYYDSMTNQLTYYGSSVMGFNKEVQCIADGGTGDVPAWLTGKINTWLARIKTGTATWLAGAKTAGVATNGDNIDYVGDTTNQYHQIYESATDGPDLSIIEQNLTPSVIANPATYEPRLKHVYEVQVDYGKKFIWEMNSFATIPYDASQVILNWTNYSGNIWYTDNLETSISPWNIGNGTIGEAGQAAIGGKGAAGFAASLATISQGKIYFDSATGRVYAWFGLDGDPTGYSMNLGGGDKFRHWGLALYYCFARYGETGYYFPWWAGTQYNLIPSATSAMLWHPSIEYNIGQPTTNGVDYNNTIGNDVWGASRVTSDRAYLFWQGNSSTGEVGKWTADWGSSLNTNHRVYARKFDNGYAFLRMRSVAGTATITTGAYTQPVTFTLPFSGRILKANNTLGDFTTQITIRQGEGIIFITTGLGSHYVANLQDWERFS